ncbi:MarR family winged helix-turn-helix transcriptional regulator [Actinomadura litoris]|uniref:MarR family winged helix-turn-helix transcriptional regulator n=1 Tax=Actinomadura litoris TaxID=2678616 RepID=UPI001C12B90C|nr:MarR family transcriptional regulator [Actinomadura litoris]
MTDAESLPEPLPGTLTFQLVVLGAIATDRFADALAPLRLKPKHAGLLAVVSRGLAASQLEVATTMGVVPSLVVSLADHLVGLGAIERVRDPADRRRQVLTLTGEGRRLLEECAAAARSVDDQLAASLPARERGDLARSLSALAAPAAPGGAGGRPAARNRSGVPTR